MLRKAVSIVMLIVLLLSALPLVFAAKFNLGDTVEVFNTGASGLVVRDSPAGNSIGKKYDGSRGMILAGPQSASYGGVVYNWWKVRWGDDALEGWSAEGYPGGVDYLRKVSISPSTKFTLGDYVKVYNMGGSSLVVRTDPPALSYKDSEVEGTFGKVEGGPFYGVAAGNAGFYHFWKVDYGSVVGWSAENWLMKATPSDLTVEDIWIEPASFYPGDTVTIYTRIKNIGSSAAVSDQGLWIKALFDSNPCYQEGIEGLGSGYAYTFQWSYTWPSNTNSHTIQVTVDPNYYIVESNENNNVRSESFAANSPPINNPPFTPSNPSPLNHAPPPPVPITADLGWSGGDPDVDDTVTYDVYFGLSSSPPLVSSGQSATTYNPSLSYATTYYWRITARDNHGASTTGPLWDFTTIPPPTEYRTLNVYSSPSGVSFTANGISHSTPWSETYAKDTPVSLEMPSDYSTADSRYYWYQWSDGVASRSRTVILSSDTTVTGTYVGPYHELTIASSPSSGIPFTLDGAAKATPYSEWLYQGYYTVEMPATYSGQTWQRWMEDGNTDRTRTVSLTHSTTLTAVYSAPPTFLLTVFTLLGGSTDPPSGTYRYDEGVVVTINAIPDSGWEFEYWELDGSNIGATNPLSVTMDRDHDLYANFRILPTPPKILPVPYYYQGDTNWCMPTSMAMVLGYYGYNTKSWDIAEYWGWSRDVQWWKLLEPSSGKVQEYFNPPRSDLTTEEIPAEFYSIAGCIDEEKPVLLSMSGISHAVVIVGYTISEGHGKVYINDPSGTLMEKFPDSVVGYLPYIAVQLDWDDVAGYIGGGPFSYAITVDGTPHCPKGSIDIVDAGVRFWYGTRQASEVYSWLYGLDNGLIWENKPWHSLVLNPEDQFQFYQYIDNHMKDDQTYGLRIEFAAYVPSLSVWVTVSSLQWPVAVKGHSWISYPGSNIMDPIPLGELLLDYGEYRITITLWNEMYTEKYDEVVFPSIRYEPGLMFQINSPADLYVTDPQGRHVGIDPSTGQVINEIPDAVYTGPGSEPQVIAIPDPLDGDYAVLLIGRVAGTYSLTAELVTLQGATAFNATDIPTATGALHNYIVDWAALSVGGEGVTVQVDSNGDSVFEYTFTSDSELTRDEFLAQTGLPVFYTFSIVWGEETFIVSVESNSTVSNFAFNQPDKKISLNVTGLVGTIGFCNVTIPKALLYAEPSDWTVLIDGASVSPIITENSTHSCLYFTYTHSTHEVQIIGTWVIGPPPPPLSVSISPLSASILVGHSVTFTSTVTGGYTPYTYQWYLNGNPVSAATSTTWSFTPTVGGIYYVYLKATDSHGNTTQSETARIAVAPPVPVGGYSVPLQVHAKAEPVIPYIALIATLTAIFTKLRPKTKRKR